MKKLNKRGEGLVIIGIIIFLLAVGVLFLVPDSSISKNPIGIKQYDILHKNEEAQASQLYIKLSADKSSESALKNIFETAGIYRLTGADGKFEGTKCGEHIYPLYSSPEGNCLPLFSSSFQNYFQDSLANYMSGYDIFPLNYIYDFDMNQEEENLIINTKATKPVYVPLMKFETVTDRKEDVDSEGIYPRGIMGSYGDEKIISCSTGECFAQIANYFYELYSSDGSTLPYIYGGESPYTYEQTVKDLEDQGPDSFFYNTKITKLQDGNTKKWTKPGFDSAGWLWWVGKHSSIDALEYRLEINSYYQKIKLTGSLICDLSSSELENENIADASDGDETENGIDVEDNGEESTICNLNNLQEKIEPGDIIFYSSNEDSMTHASIFIGDGEIIHSSLKGLSKDSLTDFASNLIVYVYRPEYSEEGDSSLAMVPLGDFSNSETNSLANTGFSSGVKLAAYGESTTHGVGASTYVEILKEEYNVQIDSTVSENNYLYYADDFKNKFDERFEDKDFDYIVVYFGANDLYKYIPDSAKGDVDTSFKTFTNILQLIYGKAQSKGYRVIAVTITPSKNIKFKDINGEPLVWSKDLDSLRNKINDWIRAKPNGVDFIVDTDKKLRDPNDHEKLLGKYDSGDHTHPNFEGYKAIAEVMYKEGLLGQSSSQGMTGIFSSCIANVDTSYIRSDEIKKYITDMDVVVSKLKDAGLDKLIDDAAQEFNIAPELIYAMIGAETGNVIDDFISGDQLCNAQGACGLMQITPAGCDKRYCKYDVIKSKVDHEMVIRTGASLLSDGLNHDSSIGGPLNPDYYFLAMSYNRGPGVVDDIIESSSTRTGIALNQVRFSDINLEDVDYGLTQEKYYRKTQASFNAMTQEEKEFEQGQAFNHPGIFVHNLAQLCGSNSFSFSFQNQVIPNNHISFTPATQTKSNINLDSMNLVTEFTKKLQEECKTNLPVCVEKVLKEFNEKHKSSITITKNEEENALALDIVDQLLSIYKEDQQNCVGVISVDFNLKTRFALETIRFYESGEVYSGKTGKDFKQTRELLTVLSFNPTRTFTGSTKNNEYVDIIIHKETKTRAVVSYFKNAEDLDEAEDPLEYLGKKQLWSTNPDLIEGTIPIDDLAVLKLASAQQIETVKTELIGPSDWCSGDEGLPSSYLDRINTLAWNSDGKTYAQAALEAGKEYGVDPALLITHSIWESSMGQNDGCTIKGKSSLTGCGWPDECAPDCSCDSSTDRFKSDLDQFRCTAEVDKNAYLEASTGEIIFNLYTHCSDFSDDSSKMWDCMLCTYQGNYAQDITNTGSSYFTKDGTCHYAENFKTTYCQWKNYFEEKGFVSNYKKQDNSCSDLVEVSERFLGGLHSGPNCPREGVYFCSSEDLQHTAEFGGLDGECCLQCGAFVSAVYRTFKGDEMWSGISGAGHVKCTSGIQVRDQNFIDEEFLQIGDIFQIDNAVDYPGSYGHTGLYVGKGFVSEGSAPKSYCYNVFTPDSEGEHVFIHSVGPICYNTLNQLQSWQRYNKKEYWTFCRPEVCGELDFTSTDGALITSVVDSPLQWIPYEEDFNKLTCKDGRKYYRFQASFPFSEETLSFSVYLENTIPVSIKSSDVEQKICGQEDLLMLSWSVPSDQEAYSFSLALSIEEDMSKSFLHLYVLERTAELTDNYEEINFKDSLYYSKDNSGSTTYFYLFNPEDYNVDLENDKQYYLNVKAEDNYGLENDEDYFNSFIYSDSESSSTHISSNSFCLEKTGLSVNKMLSRLSNNAYSAEGIEE